MRICSRCNKEVNKTQTFCPRCGFSLNKDEYGKRVSYNNNMKESTTNVNRSNGNPRTVNINTSIPKVKTMFDNRNYRSVTNKGEIKNVNSSNVTKIIIVLFFFIFLSSIVPIIAVIVSLVADNLIEQEAQKENIVVLNLDQTVTFITDLAIDNLSIRNYYKQYDTITKDDVIKLTDLAKEELNNSWCNFLDTSYVSKTSALLCLTYAKDDNGYENQALGYLDDIQEKMYTYEITSEKYEELLNIYNDLSAIYDLSKDLSMTDEEYSTEYTNLYNLLQEHIYTYKY